MGYQTGGNGLIVFGLPPFLPFSALLFDFLSDLIEPRSAAGLISFLQCGHSISNPFAGYDATGGAGRFTDLNQIVPV